ncbi:MFS transporter [candidate division WOR-3 bacterium]|nr:MFS transporter [candidate division WOR-3 bacterium]
MAKERGAIWKFSTYGFLKNLRFFEPFLLLFFLSRGLSFLQIGFLISIREIFVNLLEIPTGALADIYGKKKAMIWCFISYIVSFLIFYLGHSFIIFSLAMLFFALGETLRTGTHKAIIFDYLERRQMADQKVKIYGITRSYSKLGSALSSLIAAGLIFFRGAYGIIFLASMIPYFMDLLLMFTYPEDVITPHTGRFLFEMKRHLKETLLSFKSLKNLTVGILNISLYGAFFKISKDYLQPILNLWALSLPIFIGYSNEKRSALVIGVVYFFIYIFASTASRNANRLKNLFGNGTEAMNVFYIINLVSFLLIGILNLYKFTIPVIFLFLVLYFLRNARKPMMIGYIANIAIPSQRATVLSMENQLLSLLSLFIAPILGFLADTFGIAIVFLFSGFMLLIGYSTFKIRPS